MLRRPTVAGLAGSGVLGVEGRVRRGQDTSDGVGGEVRSEGLRRFPAVFSFAWVTSLYQLFAVSAVVMGLAHTLTRERVFAWFREGLGGKKTFLGYLVSCPYCASHYIAFVLVPLTHTYPLRIPFQWGWATAVLDWFLSSILVTVVAAFLRVIFYFVDETQGLVRRRQKVEEEEVAVRETLRKSVEANGGSRESSPH